MNPNSVRSAIRVALGALSLGILTACGGGSTDGGGQTLADGGIRGTGSSVGPVSGFGSVFVNGIRFDTEGLNGQVVSDDGISQESELDEGMILRVDGEWGDNGQGTASRVEYDDTLRGEIVVIQPWDTVTKTAILSIHGLSVNIDSQTVVSGKNVTELSTDDFVRVSAWQLPNGDFRASFVRTLTDSAVGALDPEKDIELEGQVRQFNPNLQTFELGNITVQLLLPGTDFEGIDISELAGNPFIEVEGNFDGTGRLQAREIETDDRRRYRRGGSDDIEFAGPVSEAIDPATRIFEINGLFVRVTDNTEFDDGLTEEDLLPDLLIQVEGSFLNDGITVEAEEIELREGESEVEGGISANEVFPSTQTFRIGGVLVQVTPKTTIVGDENVRLGFDSLGETDGFGRIKEVEVSGIERVSAGGEVYLEAFKIEVNNDLAGQELDLVGRLRGIEGNFFSVLGVRIDIQNAKFDDTSRVILQNMLDDQDTANPLIEVDYRRTADGDGFVADKIELEND